MIFYELNLKLQKYNYLLFVCSFLAVCFKLARPQALPITCLYPKQTFGYLSKLVLIPEGLFRVFLSNILLLQIIKWAFYILMPLQVLFHLQTNTCKGQKPYSIYAPVTVTSITGLQLPTTPPL